MRLGGGYSVMLEGRPSRTVERLPEPEALYLPLQSERFQFSELAVKDGDRMRAGQALARDPDNYSVPLLSPTAGTVRLNAVEKHIALEDIEPEEEKRHPDEGAPHVSKDKVPAAERRSRLFALGAWQFFHDAHTGALPNPSGTPRAVIVSTVRLEPFVARGDVQLYENLPSFTRGLEHLQSLLEYQPIYLVMPDIQSAFASHVRETLRGYAWIKVVEIPLRYPFDDFAVLARGLGLMHDPRQPVWALRTEGVLAIDRALTFSRPCTRRIMSIGGPVVSSPLHLEVMPGYPLKSILDARISTPPVRVINGGALTGTTIPSEQVGLDAECAGLTILPEHTEREFLGFTRPGWNRRSYSKCYLSSLRRPFRERFTTALRGERRACISCNFCEEVCPAGIMPHLIHKCLYRNALEEAERARVDLCVECGLCSFVCPSKIELRKQFSDAKQAIQRELSQAESGQGKAE